MALERLAWGFVVGCMSRQVQSSVAIVCISLGNVTAGFLD
jgi:hypothetical protein